MEQHVPIWTTFLNYGGKECRPHKESVMEVSAKKSGGTAVSVHYDLPETLEDLVEKYGEEAVATRFKGSLVISLQGFMRGLIEQSKTESEIQSAVDAWAPGVRVPKGSGGGRKLSRLVKAAQNLPPEEREEFLRQIGLAA